MAEINATRLRLRTPDGWSHRALARVEDALRTGAPDDGRLVVIRRLDLGRLPLAASPTRWSTEAGARLRTLTAHAVHAALPGAPGADAVWFADAAEARRLLLAELAAGRTPFAWFWRLALPDWRGAPLDGWLPQLIARAEHDGAALVELARAIAHVAARGELAALVAALPAAMRGAVVGAGARDSPVPIATAVEVAAPATSEAAPAVAEVAADALRLFERLPASLRVAFAAILRRLPQHRGDAVWLAQIALVNAAPELAALPTRLDARAAALPVALAPRRADGTTTTDTERDRTAPPRLPRAASPAARPGADTPDAAHRRDAAIPADQPPPAPADRAHADPIVALAFGEQRSAAAGLWLLMRPLHVMGLGDWLEDRPDLAANGFARALLHRIALRQRIAADDPLFALLPDPGDDLPTDALDAWRIGLDRWLRRRVSRRLCDVVKRPGWLVPQESEVAVRFRVDQADIALRRRALDVDAGWVPWLGLSVRYHFRDTPLA